MPRTTVRQLRLEHGLSQSELARRVAVSRPLITAVERGSTALYPKLRDALARELDAFPWELEAGAEPSEVSRALVEGIDMLAGLLAGDRQPVR